MSLSSLLHIYASRCWVRFELDTLCTLFSLEAALSDYNYKDAIFLLWQAHHILSSWNDSFFTNPEVVSSHGAGDSPVSPSSPSRDTTASNEHEKQQQMLDESGIAFSSSAPRKTSSTLLGKLFRGQSANALQAEGILSRHGSSGFGSKTNPFSTSTHPWDIDLSNINKLEINCIGTPSPLTQTNLYKWLNMFFSFAVSKASLYFFSISQIREHRLYNADLVHFYAEHHKIGVNYINW